jgi:hypothetical protein
MELKNQTCRALFQKGTVSPKGEFPNLWGILYFGPISGIFKEHFPGFLISIYFDADWCCSHILPVVDVYSSFIQKIDPTPTEIAPFEPS